MSHIIYTGINTIWQYYTKPSTNVKCYNPDTKSYVKIKCYIETKEYAHNLNINSVRIMNEWLVSLECNFKYV